ncbi:hypothetical protein J2754_001565 [Halarchaeum solikamskense]|uniref:hypothetical protein n=1 Tax=Halarchaeum nitratireducens TaxID=489913 RepID=UPI001B3AC1C0|nr:hypothetical protein [Halarchaeum solikamskense]MBP2251244.1 hypothetical protein [Halarchaeum solikamskense]
MYRFAVILAVLLAVASFAPLTGGVGVAAAQEETPSSDANGDAADDENDGESNEQEEATNDEDRTVLHELKEDGESEPGAVITDITWDGRTAKITVHANDYTTLSVNDAGAFVGISEGSSSEIDYETYTIPSGQTRTIEFDVAGGTGVKAIAITGHGTMIGAVEDGYGIISGSASWAEVQAGAAAGILFGSGIPTAMTVIIAVAGRWNHQRVF